MDGCTANYMQDFISFVVPPSAAAVNNWIEFRCGPMSQITSSGSLTSLSRTDCYVERLA